VANDVECFDWSGTRQDAVDLQRGYLDVVNSMGINARSCAARAAGYLMVFGPPRVGEPRLSPTGFGAPWESADVELNRRAILWLPLREHVPDTGERVEDIFVGMELVVMFPGAREKILAETARKQRGQPFTGGEFQMAVGVLDEGYRLDPAAAVCMNEGDFLAVAGAGGEVSARDRSIYVPRIPYDATEARPMSL
jgi:hypothetical protein